MVGVPGRSKGCKTCRKRKKGCDLQQPACGKCIRGGLICEGYARQWTFIANEPVTRGDAIAVLARRSPTKFPLTFLPDQLNRTAFETQSLSLFFDLYCPTKERLVPRSSTVGLDFRNWITVVQKLDLEDAALRPALLAFCLARIGVSHNDQAVSEQAIKLYGTALKEMNLAIRDGKRIHTDEILAAAKLMAHYEMFHGSTTPELKTRGTNWKAHTEGVIKLIQVRGPRGLDSENARLLFIDSRLSATVTAIVSRKPNFFATTAWRTLPFESKPKDVSDELHDIMATLPILLEEYDLIQACQNDGEAHRRRLRLFQQCQATDHTLRTWFADLSSKLSSPLPSVIRTPAEQRSTPEHDCFSFEVSDHMLAITLALYWSTCMLLYSLIEMIFNSLRSSGLADIPRRLPEHVDPHQSATSISRSIGYFIRPEMGIWGVQLVGFPLGVAFMYFLSSEDANGDEERQRLGANIAAMSRMGLSLGTFLTSLQAATVPWFVTDESEDPWRARSRLWFRGNPRPQTRRDEDRRLPPSDV
ncbi:MAG: hypothetical protein Q9199_002210 [Rusavskia elegans]